MATGMLIHDDRYLRNIFIGLMYLGVVLYCLCQEARTLVTIVAAGLMMII